MSTPGNHSAAQIQALNQAQPQPEAATPSWRVLHVCENVRDVLAVAEGQVAVGMRPYIVTPQGAAAAELYLAGKESGPPASLSLLRSWQDVRNWRKSILECDPMASADVVHAHSFAAGMAAVRTCEGVVYDFRDCIDDLALAAKQSEPGSWMGRSFRAAEQFILSRAAAVVVHSLGMLEAARERGAPAASLFCIPDPLSAEDVVAAPTAAPKFAFRPQTTLFFAPQPPLARTEKLPRSAVFVLDAFALVEAELGDCRLLLEAWQGSRKSLQHQVNHKRLSDKVIVVDEAASASAWQSAQVVIAMGDGDAGAANSRRSSAVCLRALRLGATLLAADLPQNRDVSPEGRGCLWFDSNNVRDLGSRMAFLGKNRDFCAALALAGRVHLLETRSHAAIGRKYSETYGHAAGRKKSKGNGPGLTAFLPATNCA